MRMRDFNALNDFLFKFIFGHKENKEIPLVVYQCGTWFGGGAGICRSAICGSCD